MNSTNPGKFSWHSRDLILAGIFIMAVLGLLNTGQGGLENFIAAADKPSSVYGDFCEYYYPAGRMISKHGQPLGGYFYTPSFALVLQLFAPDSISDARFRWQILQHLSIALFLLMPAIRLARRGRRKIWFFLYILLTLLSFPLWHNLKWGQVSVILTLLCLAGLVFYERGQKWPAAVALSLATLIKYYPGVLILYFLLNRDFRFIGRYALCLFVLGLCLPATILGPGITIDFYRLVNEEMTYALDWVAFDLNSQFFPHVASRLFGLEPDGGIRGVLTLLGLGIFLAVLLKIHRVCKAGPHDHTFTASGLLLTFPLLINTSWPHYFVYLPFCIILLLQKAVTPGQRWCVIAAAFLQSIFIYAVSGYQFYSGLGFLLLANLLLLGTWFSALKASPGSAA
ncbi:MAG TPA: glycosyltransferase family 87 protein [Candidatus Rifleibacterium sp.]|nr:glycosyltransferase family 87 protein [Candidatus Rifleibacterium sp.]